MGPQGHACDKCALPSGGLTSARCILAQNRSDRHTFPLTCHTSVWLMAGVIQIGAPPMVTKSKFVQVRLTPEERKSCERVARLMKQSLSNWMRDALIVYRRHCEAGAVDQLKGAPRKIASKVPPGCFPITCDMVDRAKRREPDSVTPEDGPVWHMGEIAAGQLLWFEPSYDLYDLYDFRFDGNEVVMFHKKKSEGSGPVISPGAVLTVGRAEANTLPPGSQAFIATEGHVTLTGHIEEDGVMVIADMTEGAPEEVLGPVSTAGNIEKNVQGATGYDENVSRETPVSTPPPANFECHLCGVEYDAYMICPECGSRAPATN